MTYDTTRVPEDTHRTIDVGTGERLTDRLIDIDRPGASATIRAVGAGWHLENIGFKGTQDDPANSALVCADTGGDRSVIDRVWLGDGGQGAGLRVRHTHSGRLDIASSVAIGWDDVGFHSTRPVGGGDGEVRYATCYSANNRGANFKTGGDLLYDCTTTADETDGRGLWAWADTNVIDSDLGAAGQHYAIHAGCVRRGVEVTLENTTYDSGYRGGTTTTNDSTITGGTGAVDYDPAMPDTVPASATDAAGGIIIVSAQDSHWQQTESTRRTSTGGVEHTIEGLDPGTEYEFRVVAEGDSRVAGITEGFSTRRSPGREETVTVEVPPNTHHHVQVGDHETFENVIFDCTNKHTCVTVTCDGANWTLRNIAFAGAQDRSNGACYSILARVDEGREGVIENVWLGDGSSVGRGECGKYGRGAILAMDTHEGHLKIRDTTIAWFPGEGIHTHTAPGDVTIENCYLENNAHSYITMGEGRGEIRNTTVVHRLGDGQ